MKIVCGACGAKYSIADEKVHGKVFKIRCKKCSNVIVVKGTVGDDAKTGATVEAAEWFIVVDGDQVGPITTRDVDTYYMSGKIETDSYIWREGMPNWVHLQEIPEFEHLFSGMAGPDDKTSVSPGLDDPDMGGAEAPGAPGEVQVDSNYYGQNADEPAAQDYAASAFTENQEDQPFMPSSQEPAPVVAAPGAEGLVSMYDQPDVNADMFSSFDAPQQDLGIGNSDYAAASSKKSNGSNGSAGIGFASADALIGTRNENSVLFSLSSLDQVKAVSADDSSGSITEGSGLIDIRALASAQKAMKGGGEGRADSIDPYQSDFAVPAFPSMGSHRSNQTRHIVIGVLLAFVIVLICGVVYMALNKQDAPAPAPVAINANTKAAPASPEAMAKHAAQLREAESAAMAAVQGKTPAAAEAPTDDTPSEGSTDKADPLAASKTVAAASSRKKPTSKRSSRKRSTASKRTTSDDIALVAPTPKRPSKQRAKKPDGDGIDDILSDIDKPKSTKKPKPTRRTERTSDTTASSDLKKSLSKSDVKSTIKRSHSRVRNCFKNNNREGLSGTLKIKFSIEPNGRVRSPRTITSKFRGSDLASCVERVIGKMKFPATQAKKPSVITYPFILR
jgi:predicted Zn finger-like uncharacterized protein